MPAEREARQARNGVGTVNGSGPSFHGKPSDTPGHTSLAPSSPRSVLDFSAIPHASPRGHSAPPDFAWRPTVGSPRHLAATHPAPHAPASPDVNSGPTPPRVPASEDMRYSADSMQAPRRVSSKATAAPHSGAMWARECRRGGTHVPSNVGAELRDARPVVQGLPVSHEPSPPVPPASQQLPRKPLRGITIRYLRPTLSHSVRGASPSGNAIQPRPPSGST